jgi:tetratricopeptide (TPR) repeat protein
VRAGGGRPLLALAAAGALAGAVGLQVLRDRHAPLAAGTPVEPALYVRSPAAMKRLVLGFDALAADVFWIRAIQHFGGERLATAGSQEYALLYPLLDLATSLDPYFNIAYRFGAIFLSEGYPGGPGRPDQAIELLKKGIAAQPGKWQYYHDIAFVHYWQLRDYRAAADWFRRASEVPNAPNWLAPMAATMLTHGRDRASARFVWQEIHKSEEAWLRRAAERGLLQLDAMDAIDMLQPVVHRVALAPGEPYSWDALLRRGAIRRIPRDPTSTPFAIDPATGVVTVDRTSPLFPLPDDRARPAS